MASLTAIAQTEVLTIEAWPDPVVESLGHDPRSLYVETFWLPVLGPSTTWLLRRLATCLEMSPTGCAINLVETSRALGLGDRTGRNAPFMRTIARSIDFEMARFAGPSALAVRTALPPLARRHVARLPASLRAEHDLLDSALLAAAQAPLDEVRQRARQLALSLIDLGEDEAATEGQLMRWRVHPALAHDCAKWAAEQRSARLGATVGGACLPQRAATASSTAT